MEGEVVVSFAGDERVQPSFSNGARVSHRHDDSVILVVDLDVVHFGFDSRGF